MRKIAGGVLWACTDCMLYAVNDERPIGRQDDEPEPWALWTDDASEITFGMLASEHQCGWNGESPREDECGCEERDFSWSSCGACGSRLGGTRHAFTWWEQ